MWGWPVSEPPGYCKNGDSYTDTDIPFGEDNFNYCKYHGDDFADSNYHYFVKSIGASTHTEKTTHNFWRENQIFTDRWDPIWNPGGTFNYPRFIPPGRKLIIDFKPRLMSVMKWMGMTTSDHDIRMPEVNTAFRWWCCGGEGGGLTNRIEWGKSSVNIVDGIEGEGSLTYAFYDPTADPSATTQEYGNMSSNPAGGHFASPKLLEDATQDGGLDPGDSPSLFGTLITGALGSTTPCNYGPYLYEIPSPCWHEDGAVVCDQAKSVDKLKLASVAGDLLMKMENVDDMGRIGIQGGDITVWEADAGPTSDSFNYCDSTTWVDNTGG